jgi:aminopeptidase N
MQVYAPEHMIKNGAGNFGAEVSAKVLAFYETYFDSEYPMPKMDSAAIPGFQYGKNTIV